MTYSADTRVFTLDPQHLDSTVLETAAACLRAGGLVAFPTETVYGLGANAFDAAAVGRIFAAKGRPASDPLIVHIHDQAQLAEVALEVPPLAHELAARFWPGPLTLVLRRGERIPLNVAAGGATVALRMPAHPVALALLGVASVPVAAPSANLFARPSPTTAQHVLDDLRGRVDIVLDGGATPVGVESTVLDLTQSPPAVLRPGGVAIERLRTLILDIRYAPRYQNPDQDAASPGMLLKHYSPRASLRLFAGERDAVLALMRQQVSDLLAAGRRVGVLTVDEDAPQFDLLGVALAALGSESDLETVARRLFAGLRDLDARGMDVILVRGLPREGLGLAVWDRLVRAAEGRVIEVGEKP